MPARRPLLLLCGTAALALAAAAIVGWAARFRVATRLIDARFSETGVPSSYRLAGLGPLGARIDALRLGDPAHPDLSVDHLLVRFGYGRHGPFVAGLVADGVRVAARLDARGLSLGTVDRLLPRHDGGGAALPDLPLDLSDVRGTLDTPNGRIALRLDGHGNPQKRFAGRAQIGADRLRLGGCALGRVEAAVQLTAAAGSPTINGPVTLAGIDCPAFRLGPGRLAVRITGDPSLRRLAARIEPAGFDGRAGPVRFAALSGRVDAHGRFGALDMNGRLGMASVAAPAWSGRVKAAAGPLASTPIGPTAARAAGAVSQLLAGAAGTAAIAVRLRGTAVSVDIDRLRLAGADGAWIAATAGRGFTWSAQGWRIDGTLRTGGGTLPSMQGVMRQAAPGGPIVGALRLLPYAAGPARIAAAIDGMRWDGMRLRFSGAARIDGPLPNGFVHGLLMPLDGMVRADGAWQLGLGCRRLAIAAARIGTVRLDTVSLPVCGAPLLAQAAGGSPVVDLRSGPVRLTGRIGQAPALVDATAVHVRADGFAVDGLAATIGDGPSPTRLGAARVDGGWTAGRFAGAGGTIGTVPLRLLDAQGRWQVAGGRLRLDGDLRIGDTAAAARFRPIAARDATLVLTGGRIDAAARLAEPESGAAVARLALYHDLSIGTGEARFVADALRFQPKGLQPDALSPLALGVVANVSGTVTGEGTVRWGPAGVSSTATFATERLDLAAAFGPVTGLSGRLRFTDLLGLVSAPDQEIRVGEVNPGVAIADGRVRFHLPGADRIAVDDAHWPFAGGALRLEPTVLDMGEGAERRLTVTLAGLDAARFVQQLDFPNIAATGTFDGTLPMRFDAAGGRIVDGRIAARAPGGTLAYVGELSSARLGTMGKLAFDALKAIRYSALDVALDGRIDGEMVSRVSFTGVRQATPEQGLAARLIRGLPFRFNIRVQAPFRGLVGSARSYADPRLLLAIPVAPVQPAASGTRP